MPGRLKGACGPQSGPYAFDKEGGTLRANYRVWWVTVLTGPKRDARSDPKGAAQGRAA